MRRGELWRYQVPALAARTVVLIATQAVLDAPGYRIFPVLQVSDTDPGHLLSVCTAVEGTTLWLDVAGGWMSARRSLLAECLGRLDDQTLTALDARIAATLSH